MGWCISTYSFLRQPLLKSWTIGRPSRTSDCCSNIAGVIFQNTCFRFWNLFHIALMLLQRHSIVLITGRAFKILYREHTPKFREVYLSSYSTRSYYLWSVWSMTNDYLFKPIIILPLCMPIRINSIISTLWEAIYCYTWAHCGWRHKTHLRRSL